MKLLQTNRIYSQEQKYLRLKTKDQDVILSGSIELRISMHGNDFGEECRKNCLL